MNAAKGMQNLNQKLFALKSCRNFSSECNNLNNKVKIYETIRQNGGWSNWDMNEIAKYNCSDHTEARIKEQEHYELLKANLNVNPPFVYCKKYFCKKVFCTC